MTRPIVSTPQEHRAAMARISQLMDAEAGTEEAIELEMLATVVAEYEHVAFPPKEFTEAELTEFIAQESQGT